MPLFGAFLWLKYNNETVDKWFKYHYNKHIDSNKQESKMSKIWKLYEKRVNKYEAEGMTRSDAQGVVEAEFLVTYGPGWEFR